MDGIKERVDQGIKQVVVVGAGFIGLELVENFVKRGIAATAHDCIKSRAAFSGPQRVQANHFDASHASKNPIKDWHLLASHHCLHSIYHLRRSRPNSR